MSPQPVKDRPIEISSIVNNLLVAGLIGVMMWVGDGITTLVEDVSEIKLYIVKDEIERTYLKEALDKHIADKVAHFSGHQHVRKE